jgi:hypothetical protein
MHSSIRKPLHNARFAALGSVLLMVVACGRTPANSNLPKPLKELAPDPKTDRTFIAESERWDSLRNKLKLSESRNEQSLREPSFTLKDLPESHALHDTLTSELANEHLKTEKRTVCAEVVEMEDLGAAKKLNLAQFLFGELSGARWYLMKYKRKLASGETDSLINGAIVAVPETNGSYPVIAYAHAGDEGLSQFELAGVFGEEQLNYIIVAPAFPGEGITASKNFSAVGTSDPYSTDAEDLLAAHNCLIDTAQVPATMNLIRSKIKRRTTGAYAGQPVSATVGLSRGGMASLIAHAKNESMRRAGLAQAKYFSCAATAINPSSLTFGEFRVYLEAAVRGKAESTGFFTLPTAPQLNEVLKSYRMGASVEETALELQKRDSTFNAQLILSSLRNWSTDGKGSLLFMHGTLDQKIPISQGIIGSYVFNHVNQRLARNATIPGVQMTSLSFVPESKYLSNGGKTLVAGQTMHGDLAWFTSSAKYSTVTERLTSLELTPLNGSDFGKDKMPLDVLGEWLKDTNRGCASTY